MARRFVNVYKLFTSILSVIFGLIILYRSIKEQASFQMFLLALAFVGLGSYRIILFWRHLRQISPQRGRF